MFDGDTYWDHFEDGIGETPADKVRQITSGLLIAGATGGTSKKLSKKTTQKLKKVTATKYDVPAGSKVNCVVALLGSIGLGVLVPGVGALKVGQSVITRTTAMSSGIPRVKNALANTGFFKDVTVRTTSGGGAFVIDLIVLGHWSEVALRNFIAKQVKAAGYPVNNVILKVNDRVRNAPTAPQGSPTDIITNTAGKVATKVGETALETAKDSATGLFSNMGYLLPLALLGGGILLFIALKK